MLLSFEEYFFFFVNRKEQEIFNCWKCSFPCFQYCHTKVFSFLKINRCLLICAPCFVYKILPCDIFQIQAQIGCKIVHYFYIASTQPRKTFNGQFGWDFSYLWKNPALDVFKFYKASAVATN